MSWLKARAAREAIMCLSIAASSAVSVPLSCTPGVTG